MEQISDVTHSHEKTDDQTTIFAVRTVGTKPPLFLVHGIGGTVNQLYPMVNHLPLDRPVYAIESPRSGSVPPANSVEEMAARYVRDIRTVQPVGPYHFFGYSLGGLIGFEIAQQLSRIGQHVAFLGMLDTPQLGGREGVSTRSVNGCVGSEGISGCISHIWQEAQTGWNTYLEDSGVKPHRSCCDSPAIREQHWRLDSPVSTT